MTVWAVYLCDPKWNGTKVILFIIYFAMNGLVAVLLFSRADQEKVADYEMKLMNIDMEHLGIPVSNGGSLDSTSHQQRAVLLDIELNQNKECQ